MPLYDDNGNEINPNLIPVPSLCIVCRLYDVEDWEENILCNLNRFDQQYSEEFKCGAFDSKNDQQ